MTGAYITGTRQTSSCDSSQKKRQRERKHFLPCRNKRASSYLTCMQRILLAIVLPLSENGVDPLCEQKAKLDETVETSSTSAEHSRGKGSAAKRGTQTKPTLTATKDANEFTLEELQKEDGGLFTIKPAVTIAVLCRDRYSCHRCVGCRMSDLPNAEGKYGCAQHPVAKTKEIYRLRILLRQDDLNMWVNAFADVAELIMGVSVEEFNAFDDEGRKKIAWGERNEM